MMDIAVTADGKVAQYGTGLGLMEGQALVALDDAQETALLALLASGQPSAGLTFVGGAFALAQAPAPAPAVPNAVDVVVQALATIPNTDPGFNVAQTVLQHLQAAGLH